MSHLLFPTYICEYVLAEGQGDDFAVGWFQCFVVLNVKHSVYHRDDKWEACVIKHLIIVNLCGLFSDALSMQREREAV